MPYTSSVPIVRLAKVDLTANATMRLEQTPSAALPPRRPANGGDAYVLHPCNHEAPDPRDERGVMIVLFAIVLPLLLIIGVDGVDVGNWWTHRQASADQGGRGGVRGGVCLGFPCGDRLLERPESSPKARKYVGPAHEGRTGLLLDVRRTTRRSAGTPGEKIHVVLNGADWYDEDTNPNPPNDGSHRVDLRSEDPRRQGDRGRTTAALRADPVLSRTSSGRRGSRSRRPRASAGCCRSPSAYRSR